MPKATPYCLPIDINWKTSIYLKLVCVGFLSLEIRDASLLHKCERGSPAKVPPLCTPADTTHSPNTAEPVLCPFESCCSPQYCVTPVTENGCWDFNGQTFCSNLARVLLLVQASDQVRWIRGQAPYSIQFQVPMLFIIVFFFFLLNY